MAASDSALACARDRLLDPADHVGLPLGEIAAAARHRRDEAGDEPVRRALHRRRNRGLLQFGDHAHQAHRLLAEGVAARIDRAAIRDELAHLLEMLAALLEQRLHLVGGAADLLAEIAELVRHLRQQLHDGAGAGRAGELAAALGFRELGEARRRHLDVGQQALRRERIVVRAVEIGGVVLHRDREVLLDRGGAGERRGIEPGRHGDDHQRAEPHAGEQQAPALAILHMRQEAHQEGPERVDADRDRDRVNDRRKEHDRGVAVQQVADAEIGVDAARQREHGERDLGGDFKT